MELSINAIVTIVIALTLLALGLGLTGGLLSFGGGSLAQAVEGYRLEIPATSGDPLVISNPLSLESRNSNIVLVNFYNVHTPLCDNDHITVGAWFYLDCPELSIRKMQTVTLDIPVGTQKTLGVSLYLADDVDAGTYSCFARIYCDKRYPRVNDGILIGDPQVDSVFSKAIFVEVR